MQGRRHSPSSLFTATCFAHVAPPVPSARRIPQSIMRAPWWRYGGVVVKFKPLLDRWKKDAAPVRTVKEYPIRLELDDAARLHALAELFPGQPIEGIITDLLHAGLDEIAAAMPYERGSKVISRDDHGDPLYEDVGLTPRFVELTRKFKRKLEVSG